MASSARPRRRRWPCMGCGVRRARRRWNYCTVCVARLERGVENLDFEYSCDALARALRGRTAPVPAPPPERIRDPLPPDAPITCSHYGCTMPLRVCLQRQDARWPGAGHRAALYGYCATRCVQGRSLRRRTTYSAGTHWASKSKRGSRNYQTYRRDAGLQRRRMRLYTLSRPVGAPPDLDHPPGLVELPKMDLDDPDVREVLAAS